MKTIAMVSGGIDSPVAAKIMKSKIILHFCLYPYYCTGSFKLFLEVWKKLNAKLFFIPWNNVLAISSKVSKKNQCILCRKSMFKCAELLAKQESANAIITGEAVGQKASQTLSNMQTTSHNIKIPFIRPLIGMTKEDIIKKSKELGLWMPQHTGCCKIVPESPATKSSIEESEFLYEKIKPQVDDAFQARLEIKDKNSDWNKILKKFI